MYIKAQNRSSFSVHKDVAVILDLWGCSFTKQVGVPLDERRVKATEREPSPLRSGKAIVFCFLTSFIEVEGSFPPFKVTRGLDFGPLLG